MRAIIRACHFRFFPVMVIFSAIFMVSLAGQASAGSGTVDKGVMNFSILVDDAVPYDSTVGNTSLDRIKTCIKNTSDYLYTATYKQNRLGSVTIIVPASWPSIAGALDVGTFALDKVDIKMPDSDIGDAVPDGFGAAGHINFGYKNITDSSARVVASMLTHEFGHYAYGLYDEYTNIVQKGNPPKWYLVFCDSNGKWLKCTKEAEWETSVKEVLYDSASYSVKKATSPDTNHSSIMWYPYLSPITSFCYGDHYPEPNNDQNLNHKRQSCWHVMATKTKFSLKLPDDKTLTAITYQEPTFTVLQQKKKRAAGFSLEGATDLQLYEYPRPVRIVACLYRNGTPVSGASVSATVTAPDSTASTLPLGDGGLMGDSFPLDGTYEGYFVDFKGDGAYQVSIKANNDQHSAYEGIAFSDVKPPISSSVSLKERLTPITDDFSCEVQADPFNVSGYLTKDLIPPGPVENFNGQGLSDGTVKLAWIAPGNNMYEGRASSYEMRYSSAPISTDAEWAGAAPLAGLPVPGNPGDTQEYTTPLFAGGSYYFALKASDSTGASSEMAVLAVDVTASSEWGTNMPVFTQPASSSGGSCFIATAAYGSPQEPHVTALRQFRDRVLLKNAPGRLFVAFYYALSPPAARIVASSPMLRAFVRWHLGPIVAAVRHPWAALVLMSAGSLCLGAVIAVKRKTGPRPARRR
ncbi:MAG: CFI-box-CTERM domain-containing protein [Candidatus Eremiobacteraeota bacterium]|nr:CFI-box-CTERM domain-containing protein [Candidatus Eremiobacteraeota bacterium]